MLIVKGTYARYLLIVLISFLTFSVGKDSMAIEMLPLEPSLAGVENTFQATGATPGGDVRFLWGFSENISTENSICNGLEVGILKPRTLVDVTADQSGVATFVVLIPPNFHSVDVVLQAVDITTCTASNVTHEIFENVPVQPPTFVLEELFPSMAGLTNNISVRDATPNSEIAIIVGFQDAAPPINVRPEIEIICEGFVTDIIMPSVFRTILSDENGDASLNVDIPRPQAGRSIFIQAVDLSLCEGSNIVSTIIGDYPGELILTEITPHIFGGGIINSYTIENAIPGGELRLVISFNIAGGSESYLLDCSFINLDLVDPFLADVDVADEFGHLDGEFSIFPSTPGDFLPVYLQAIDMETCRTSNLRLQYF